MKQIIVVGGSIAGLVSALALARDGHRVTVLEKDAAPMPPTPDEAFDRWERRGAPQIWQSHAFLGRMHRDIRDREPELLAELLAYGAEQLSFRTQAAQYFDDPEFEPGDDDIVLLACRRTTFEWVLRRHVLATGLVAFRDGVEVLGLVGTPGEAGEPAHVTGVKIAADGGETELSGDLVIDASGRRTRLPQWLAALGVPKLREESQDCGIFYSSRFYRLREGVERPNEDGIIGGDLGYLKFGIFPGDSGTFSVTLAAAPDDDVMRSILRTPGFEAAVASLPMVWAWVDPEVSAPIADVIGMANLRNLRRHLVENGEPVVLGLFALGDALVHANPITGRGCSLAWITAYAFADSLRKHPDDLRALALDLEATIERELAPWLAAQIQQDRDAVEVNAAQRRGEDPYQIERPDGTNDPKAFARSLVRDGLMPAMREDLHVLRTFMRVGHMLEPPEVALRRPEIMRAALKAYEGRHARPPRAAGPSRREMLELLAARAS